MATSSTKMAPTAPPEDLYAFGEMVADQILQLRAELDLMRGVTPQPVKLEPLTGNPLVDTPVMLRGLTQAVHVLGAQMGSIDARLTKLQATMSAPRKLTFGPDGKPTGAMIDHGEAVH